MNSQQYDPRPYVAALLGSLVTGLGHLYLGRWKRALGWFVLLVWSSAVFVDPQATQSLVSGGLTVPLSAVPLFLISILSVLDVFIIARRKQNGSSTNSATSLETCPTCGKDLDPDLAFCSWCGSEPATEQTT